MIRMFNAMKNITSPFFFLSFFAVCTVMVSRNIVAARNPNHKFLHFVDSTQKKSIVLILSLQFYMNMYIKVIWLGT